MFIYRHVRLNVTKIGEHQRDERVDPGDEEDHHDTHPEGHRQADLPSGFTDWINVHFCAMASDESRA